MSSSASSSSKERPQRRRRIQSSVPSSSQEPGSKKRSAEHFSEPYKFRRMTEVMTPWVHSEWEALGDMAEHEWWQWQEWIEPEGEWEDADMNDAAADNDPVQHDAHPADHLQHVVAPPADHLRHDVAPPANAHADAGGPAAPPDELME